MAFSELIAMKKSKKVPSEGEIFVLQPLPNQFYYAKVIQTNINSRDSFINGMTLIYIYNKVSQDRHVPQNLDNEELLIAPTIVNNQLNKHGKEMMDVLGKDKYNIKDYLNDANYVVQNGAYIPEMNGFVRPLGG